MIPESQAVLDHLAKRQFVRAHHHIRIEAKNRTTGAVEAMGLWDGPDNQNFTMPGVAPLDYLAAGRILDLPQFEYEIGLDARTYEIGLTHVDDAVNNAIRGYDPRFGSVLIWRTNWNDAGQQIGTPRPVFRGFIDGTPIDFDPEGSGGGIKIKVVSEAKLLTHYGFGMKNHEFQKRRNNDQFRQYSSVVEAEVPWGTKFKTNTNTKRNNLSGNRRLGI